MHHRGGRQRLDRRYLNRWRRSRRRLHARHLRRCDRHRRLRCDHRRRLVAPARLGLRHRCGLRDRDLGERARLGRQHWEPRCHAAIRDPLGRGVHLAEMHREGTVDRGQRRQPVEERLQPLRHYRRQGRRRDPRRLRPLAVHRQHEGPRAPGAAILLAQQRIDHLQCLRLAPRDPERQRVAPRRFVAILLVAELALQRHAVFALGALLLADQVVGQPAIRRDPLRIDAVAVRKREVAQRLARPFGTDQDRSHSALHPRLARVDLVGAREQRRCRAEIVELER